MTERLSVEHLSIRRIFWFWLPLAAMWFMMALEIPLIAAFVARMPNPKVNLAAYGVIFSIALIIEGPVIMLLSAATALSKGALSYRRLLHFSHFLIFGLTAIHLIIGLTPLFDVIMTEIIGVPEEVAKLGRGAFLVMAPWSASVGYRRLWQGVLIQHQKTRVLPITIVIRLIVTAGIMMAGYSFGGFSGVFAGAISLAGGVVAAAVAAFLFARPVVRQLIDNSDEKAPISWRGLLIFYAPLAFTSLILLTARPVLSSALSRLPMAIDSLAVWPVLTSMSFLGRSIAMSFQEVAIALLNDKRGFMMLRKFALALCFVMILLFALFALTPLSELWFSRVAGLPKNLTRMIRAPMLIIALLPGISSLIALWRGVLVNIHRTLSITRSVLVNIAVLVALLFGIGFLFNLPGIVIVAIAYLGSVVAEWIYLYVAGSRHFLALGSPLPAR